MSSKEDYEKVTAPRRGMSKKQAEEKFDTWTSIRAMEHDGPAPVRNRRGNRERRGMKRRGMR